MKGRYDGMRWRWAVTGIKHNTLNAYDMDSGQFSQFSGTLPVSQDQWCTHVYSRTGFFYVKMAPSYSIDLLPGCIQGHIC